ncbi:hypothetical protein Glove_243g116 [Diversispora epigaea]|uniref:C2H2-type domain-containing protein n=1 Tax=Diversispora epigaea TaxID=1348612 RepID=A0A397IDI3_9GLOM|nr:hypothetical protein Glove_243g116 [Diversispora epigaea]
MIYTCDRCEKNFPKRWKLTRHTERQYQCRAKAFVSEPAPISIPTQILEKPEIQDSASVPSQDTNSIPEITHAIPKSVNDRLSSETVKQWGSRLRKRYKELTYENYEQPRTLRACQILYDTLLQIDGEAYGNIEPIKQTNEEQEFFGELENEVERQVSLSAKRQVIEPPKAGPCPKTQAYRKRKNEQSKIPLKTDQTNEEFERLSPALKRRAVAVHNAKVPRYHPDNGNDIRKMLESQRKPFRELLEKEFDKRGQFKFSLCSLTKFLIDDKPDNKEKDKKKNSRTDWLRNKQIIMIT